MKLEASEKLGIIAGLRNPRMAKSYRVKVLAVFVVAAFLLATIIRAFFNA